MCNRCTLSVPAASMFSPSSATEPTAPVSAASSLLYRLAISYAEAVLKASLSPPRSAACCAAPSAASCASRAFCLAF